MKKSEAFRLAVEALGIEAPIGDIVDHMKEKFNVEIDKNMASTYRSNFKKKLGVSGTLRKPAAKSSTNSNDALDFMTTIRDWERKLSPEMIQKLVNVMYQG
ncbi:hypothetical protein KIH39_12225 [Telmatocola sphagniphila]|uniref:Uncharacterized protein n=1 Tax=Telmatocola sphagniphila TaxID=1123043 RepID=A0A8E6BA95_9BACT|nr:hypothetical protein [Telmatocola sphagniphila]QVL34636.1 hypothetical protein KIH39_12225 [Telmatocola sphagniphila]